MSETSSGTVAERISRLFETLTHAERKLSNVILENYPVSGLGTITALAETAEVSAPTVARMARKLGYGGFPEMQTALRTELEATLSSPIAKHDSWAANAPDTHILNRFAEAVTDNLRQTLQQLDLEDFDAVVDLLSDPSRNIYVVGGRISRSMADYLFTHMQVIRDRVTLIPPNSNTWPHYVLNMTEGDVLVAFDIRRYEHDTHRLAEMATEQGAQLVLFTDQWGSPAARHAKHGFRARIEAPSAWDSSVVIMFILEALIAAVETERWEEARDRMKTLEHLFDRTKLFRKFT